MDVSLRTPRLLLRQPVMADAERIARYLDNFAVSGNLSRVPYPYRLADAKGWLRTWRADTPAGETGFTIELPGEGLIGHVGFHSDVEGTVLGYWLVPLPTIDPIIVARSGAALPAYGPKFRYSHWAGTKTLRYAAGGAAAMVQPSLRQGRSARWRAEPQRPAHGQRTGLLLPFRRRATHGRSRRRCPRRRRSR